MTGTLPDLEQIRQQFPALLSGFAYMDNAGGSQVPLVVADAMRNYMLNSYVQVGATYPASVTATETVAEAHRTVETLMGAEGNGRVILGSSTSTLCRMLSDLYADVLSPGDEIIVAESGHEANIFPWVELEKRGLVIRIWKGEDETGRLRAEHLADLLTARTKIVAFPHVSNILGAVEDAHTFIEMAHRVGARVVLDSVAYAPHLLMSVAEWGVDWCVYSTYKVFGPHMAGLYGSNEAIAELTGRNHPFIARDYIPGKFELGGVSHEGCAALVALEDYLQFISGSDRYDRVSVARAYQQMDALERPLTATLIKFLRSKPNVKIIGPASAGPERVATISFTHNSLSSREIATAVQEHQIGIRFGNFYSVRLLQHLGIDVTDGVTRVSFAHYNSPAEVDRLIAALDGLL